MKRIVLVRLPFYSLANLKHWKLFSYPLGLAYLSSSLKSAGHSVNIVDGEILPFDDLIPKSIIDYDPVAIVLQKENPEFVIHMNYSKTLKPIVTNAEHAVWDRVLDTILKYTPDIVGFLGYTSSMNAIEIMARKVKERTRALVVVGGAHPTAIPIQTLEFCKDIDAAFIGDSENNFVKFIDYLEGKARITEISNISYRDKDGVHLNEQLSSDGKYELDNLPFPDRDLSYKELYNGDVILTSRGCPFRCTYCASGNSALPIKYRDVKEVVKEIMLLKNDYNTKFIRIVDDTFTANKKRVKLLSDLIVENNLHDIEYSVGSTVALMDEGLAASLVRMGVKRITFGVESGSEKILRAVNKNIKLDEIINAIKITTAYGIKAHCFFMIGFPYETQEDVYSSIDLIDKICNDKTTFEFNIVTPYPGTQLFTQAFGSEHIENIRDWFKFYHQSTAKLNNSFMSADEINFAYSILIHYSKYIISYKKSIIA